MESQEFGIVPENDPKDLPLRFHHVRNLIFHRRAYQNDLLKMSLDKISGPNIPFEELYRHPQKVEEFVDTFINREREKMTDVICGRAGEDDYGMSKEYVEDLAGKDGDNLQSYLSSLREVEMRLVGGDPATVVSFTWGPDILCFSCKGNGENKPGSHCLLPASEEYNADMLFYKSIESAREDPVISKDIQETEDLSGRHVFKATLGGIRSPGFLNGVWNSYMGLTKSAQSQ